MPTYLFKDKTTGKQWKEMMGISEADEYLAANPHIERLVNGAPRIVSGRPLKPDNEFRSLLKQIKKRAGKRAVIDTY